MEMTKNSKIVGESETFLNGILKKFLLVKNIKNAWNNAIWIHSVYEVSLKIIILIKILLFGVVTC